MKDRKVLALILVLILVLSSFSFAFADTELLQDQDIEEIEVPENPDNLSEGITVKAPSIKTSGGDLRTNSFSISEFVALTDEGNNIPWDQPGSIKIDKYATPVDGIDNQWKITLEVEGKNHATTSDIVLLIDRSGSMSGSKLTAAQNAAQNFVNQLMPDPTKTNIRIAVVSFAGNVTVDSGFKTAADKQDLIDAIDFTANGGTFIQAGLKQASALLSSSVADSKNIVLLGDGEATYSYGIDEPNDYLEYWYTSSGRNYYRTTSAVPESEFEYSSTVGDGTSAHTRYESGTGYRNYYRHGANSVAEAGFIKASSHTIYTIALETNTEGTWTLNNIASPGKAYSGSSGDLTTIYNSISAEIVYAAEDAVITDPMGAMFSIPGIDATNYNDHIHVSRGTVSWNNDTETITWNLGNITEVVATMWYIVELAPEALPDVDYPTNEATYVDYTNINDESAKMYFPIPEVKITEGPPPPTGTLTIAKEVYIDGDEDPENQTVFTFMVDGETVTASAINSGTIELEVGSYVVTETAFGMYTPDATTLQAIVTTQGGLVTFVNRYTTPPTDGTLIVDKIVTGDLADDEDVFVFNIYPQQDVSIQVFSYSVTASAITDGSIQLPEGYYMVVETEYGEYTPSTTSQFVWITAGQTTSVAFYNDWSSEEPTPGNILINKTVTGNRSNTSDIFTYDIEPYYFESDNGPMPTALQMPEFPIVVTASAITDGYAVHLEPGWYLVTERDPSPYNLTSRSSNDPEYELDGARGIIVYVSEDSQTVVNFTNRYNISTPSSDYRMSITKSADAAEVNVGDLITYTITVTNTGDVTLTNVAVVDEMVGLDEVIATLGVGASETFTATYLATEVGLLENTATATDNQAPTVSDEALVFVVQGPPLGVPGLTINKTVVGGTGQVFNPGDTVQFKIVVTNTGTETLENILVEDVLAGFLQVIPSLNPGQSQEFVVSVKLDANFANDTLENIATATNSKTGTLQDTASILVEEVVEIEEEEPPLAIPDTGADASVLLYGAGAMLSLLGVFKKKRR